MSIKILANDGIDPIGKKKLEEKSFIVSSNNIPQEELINHINEYDVLTVRSATKVRKPLIDACTNLKLIVRGGVGLDNIDVEYAESKGIKVRNTPLASSQSVAELVFAHLFTGVRFLYESNRLMPNSTTDDFKKLKEKYAKGSELSGKTLGIIGFGNIGRAVAKMALGLGMKVKAYDLYPSTANIELSFQDGQKVTVKVEPLSKEEVIQNSDFITVHSAGSTEVLSASDFKIMKKGVMIINCARGGVIKEADLLNALNDGTVSYAGIDVFEEEPTKNTVLLQHPLVSLTPHIGANTKEAQERVGLEVADIIMKEFK
jgi:D-3-phosphoglycerate dehydrogenase